MSVHYIIIVLISHISVMSSQYYYMVDILIIIIIIISQISVMSSQYYYMVDILMPWMISCRNF